MAAGPWDPAATVTRVSDPVPSLGGVCLHSRPPAPPERSLREGERVDGVVVCAHPFGLGVHLPAAQDFGHVDVPFIGVDGATSLGLDDLPAIGTVLALESFGRNWRGQLKLRAVRPG